MAIERLHAFTLDLCDYVIGQIRPHLRSLPHRPQRPLPSLDYNAFNGLSLTEWIGRGVATLPVNLDDHVWAGVLGDAASLPLSDDELFALELAVDDPPARCETGCVWVPAPALHRRAVECVHEIRVGMTKQTAEEWALDCAGFSARLSGVGLRLADGVVVVQQWLTQARWLMNLIDATRSLPHPLDSHAAPALPSPSSQPALRPGATAPARRERGHSGKNEGHCEPQSSDVCGWREAMVITGLKKTKLYEMFHRRALTGYRDGGMIRFYRTGLRAYMHARENPAAPPPRRAARPLKNRTPLVHTGFKFL